MEIAFNFPLLLTGYLLASKDEKISSEKLLSIDSIFINDSMMQTDGWESFIYESKQPLLGEDEIEFPGPYKYLILCRRSGLRVLLLSAGKQVIDHLINIYSHIYQPRLIPIRFEIQNLVSGITSNPIKYALTAVHARVDAFGGSLKAISFYGDDIGEAIFFRENIELLSCFSCGIRDILKKYELIRISAEGIISFRLYNFRELLDIKNVLKYIAENQYYIYPEGYSDYHQKELE